MKINRLVILVVLIGLMAFTAACGGDSQDNSQNTSAGNNDLMADNAADAAAGDAAMESMVISGDLVLDAALIDINDLASQVVSSYIYDTLVKLDNQSAITPGLALSYEVSDQGLEYQFSLRTDAVFADGTPITADVILENFNRWFDPEHPLHGADSSAYVAWLEYFKGFRGELDTDGKPVSLFDGIEKVDDLTVLVHLNQPMDDFLSVIARPFFSILNPEVLGADYGMMGGTIDGSGAYMVEDWTTDGMTLAPNSEFWGEVPSEALHLDFE